MANKKFKTEVSKLLHLIIHSLYSHKEIFLRELISNGSDALDKLKFLTLTEDAYKKVEFNPSIDISFQSGDNPTLTIADTGIGMNEDDLNDQLGTIARSGTSIFLEQMEQGAKKDANLIGQFGVGFYSCFMVASKVEVLTKKAGTDQAYRWVSTGETSYSITEDTRDGHGTTIILHLNDEGKEYTSRWQLESLIKKYSDHVAFPIFLNYEETLRDDEGKETGSEVKREQVNSAAAIWKRSKSELKDEDYNEFYKSLAHDGEDPLLHIHTNAEGTLEYTTLFYVPKKAPFDMYQADYKPGVKLYVKRVFITDDEKELMPVYLRFLRGVIDSEDLPLNVSREILQQNRVMSNIRNASVKKVLGEFENLAKSNPKKYEEFIAEYNRPLKEGLYSDFTHKEQLMELVRFKSTEVEGYTGLASYKERLKDEQKKIYYLAGGSEEMLRNSPLLGSYKKKGIEVLIMDDDIDEIVLPMVGTYKELEFVAINKSGVEESEKDEKDKKAEEKVSPLLEKIKKALGDRVKDVVASSRLEDAPACVVVDSNDPSVQMQQMMKAMGQKDIPAIVPILEVNPKHKIVKKLAESTSKKDIENISWILLEQSLMMEGVAPKDPVDFVKRLNDVVAKSLD